MSVTAQGTLFRWHGQGDWQAGTQEAFGTAAAEMDKLRSAGGTWLAPGASLEDFPDRIANVGTLLLKMRTVAGTVT